MEFLSNCNLKLFHAVKSVGGCCQQQHIYLIFFCNNYPSGKIF